MLWPFYLLPGASINLCMHISIFWYQDLAAQRGYYINPRSNTVCDVWEMWGRSHKNYKRDSGLDDVRRAIGLRTADPLIVSFSSDVPYWRSQRCLWCMRNLRTNRARTVSARGIRSACERLEGDANPSGIFSTNTSASSPVPCRVGLAPSNVSHQRS